MSKSESHTLLIWEINPEGVELYLIPDSKITPEGREVLARTHGRMLNSTNTTPQEEGALEILSIALSTTMTEDDLDNPDFGKWIGCWAVYKWGRDTPIQGSNITCVYSSGFLM